MNGVYADEEGEFQSWSQTALKPPGTNAARPDILPSLLKHTLGSGKTYLLAFSTLRQAPERQLQT